MQESYDPRFLKGIELFNEGEFFECHDELEEVWTETIGPEREFYQGLIHAAVCLFHFEGTNLGGARKMYDSCCRYLEPYGSSYFGVNLEKLLSDLTYCFRELLKPHKGYPTGVTLDPKDIPSIEHDPAFSGTEN